MSVEKAKKNQKHNLNMYTWNMQDHEIICRAPDLYADDFMKIVLQINVCTLKFYVKVSSFIM